MSGDIRKQQIIMPSMALLTLLLLLHTHLASAHRIQHATNDIDVRDVPENVTEDIVRLAETAGQSCGGSEGQWNCMTSSWQRCASGRWSVVMQCAAGTICTPSGLTYDFRIQHSNSGGGGSTSGGSGSSSTGFATQVSVVLVLGSLCAFAAMLA